MPGDDLYLGAPEGQAWPLSIEQVEPRLRERFPDSAILRKTSLVTRKTRLSFTIPFPDGNRRHGIYIDHDNLALSDGEVADWADTIAWFLGLLPPGTPCVAMRGEGPVFTPLPAQIRTSDDVIAFFDALA